MSRVSLPRVKANGRPLSLFDRRHQGGFQPPLDAIMCRYCNLIIGFRLSSEIFIFSSNEYFH